MVVRCYFIITILLIFYYFHLRMFGHPFVFDIFVFSYDFLKFFFNINNNQKEKSHIKDYL